jgi:hypothetical protein
MLLRIYGLLVLMQAAFGPPRMDGSARGDLALAASHFVITVVVAAGLRRARRWSWWGALCLASLGLFFTIPIAMGFFLAMGEGPLRSLRESALVLSSFVTLVLLATLLVAGRRSLGFERERDGPA